MGLPKLQQQQLGKVISVVRLYFMKQSSPLYIHVQTSVQFIVKQILQKASQVFCFVLFGLKVILSRRVYWHRKKTLVTNEEGGEIHSNHQIKLDSSSSLSWSLQRTYVSEKSKYFCLQLIPRQVGKVVKLLIKQKLHRSSQVNPSFKKR